MTLSVSLIFSLSASLVLLAAIGCAREMPNSALREHSSVHEVGTGATRITSTPSESRESVSAEPDSIAQSECQEGQELAPGDRCTYPGTAEEFWVDDAGIGHFLTFSASSVISVQNAMINSYPYEFAASKGQSGKWNINIVGRPSDTVRVSDILATVAETPTPALVPSGARTTPQSPSPVPSAHLPANSVSPTPIVDQRPTRTPSTGSLPPPTPSATATSRAPSISSHSSLAPTPTPELPMIASTTVPSSPLPMALQRLPKPEIEDIPTGTAVWGDQVVNVDESIVLNLANAFSETVYDGVRRYRALVGNSAVAAARVDPYTGLLTLKAIKPGTTWVATQVCNSQRCSKLGSATIRLTVPPLPNRPPQAVGSVAVQQLYVGEIISVSVASAFWDLEGDSIVGYELAIGNADLVPGIEISPNGVVSIEGAQTGSTSVSIRACDGHGCGLEETALNFSLEVFPAPNKPPVAHAGIADQTVHVGQTISLDLSPIFDDPEGDPIEDYGFSRGDKSVVVGKVHSETDTLTLRGARVGTTYARVDARDSGSGSRSTEVAFKITVKQPPRNPPMVIGTISDRTLDLGDTVYVPVSYAFVTSPRYRIIRYDFLLNNPEKAVESEISRDGILKLRGSEEGKTRVSVRACSYAGCSEFSEVSFVAIVIDSDYEPNTNPEVVGALSDRRLTVGDSVSLNVSEAFSDPDDDAIVDYRYEMSHPRIAMGSSISNTGVLILRGSEVGKTSISISACDDENDCSDPDEMNFTLLVEAP